MTLCGGTLLTLLSGLICLGIKQNYGAAVCGALFLLGVFFLFWDSKIKYLYGFLDGFPRYEENGGENEDGS